MRDYLELVARPKGVVEAFMSKDLVCLTAPKTADARSEPATVLANLEPLPYTLLVKGKFWYFRTRKHGTVRIRGEYRSPVFMRHYHRLLREHGKCPEIKKPDPREIYFVGWDGGPVKIGITGFHRGRLNALQSGCPYELKIYAVCKGGRPMERVYHKRFAKHHLRGEWFERGPEIEAEIERLITQKGDGSSDIL